LALFEKAPATVNVWVGSSLIPCRHFFRQHLFFPAGYQQNR